MLRTAPYDLGTNKAFSDAEASKLRGSVSAQLTTLRLANEKDGVRDSPCYQLLPDWNPPPLSDSAAESFRADARQAEKMKDDLDRLRTLGQEPGQAPTVQDALVQVRTRLLDEATHDAGLLSSSCWCTARSATGRA